MSTRPGGRHWIGVVCCLAAFALALPPRMQVEAQAQPVRILFMHHSTGAGLIAQGGVREAFSALGYEFWDHGYNDEGLTDASGAATGVNWDVPGDNTDPDGWQAIFAQPVTDPPDNTFSHMLAYDVIIFKSCFPNSNITDEAMLDAYQRYFLDIRDVIEQHPDKLFIAFTTPPLVPNETTLANAERARRWAAYLTSDEYLAGHPNLAVFDFFSALADADGYLRAEYRSDEWDSHPNERANQQVGPVFVDFVDSAIRSFEPGSAPSEAVAVPTATATPAVPVESGPAAGVTGELLADFEDAVLPEVWWTYTNEPVTRFDCALDRPGYAGQQALHLTFEIPAEGSAGCGVDLRSDAQWAATQGLRFYGRSDAPGLVLRVMVGVSDPDKQLPGVVDATPFEIELAAPGTDWQPVVIPWSDLERATWVGDTGIETLDLTHVVWIAFDVGKWDAAQTGSIWIDDLALVPAAE